MNIIARAHNSLFCLSSELNPVPTEKELDPTAMPDDEFDRYLQDMLADVDAVMQRAPLDPSRDPLHLEAFYDTEREISEAYVAIAALVVGAREQAVGSNVTHVDFASRSANL